VYTHVMTLDQRLPVLVDEDTRRAVNTSAEQRHVTMGQWIREAIREKLEREAGR
jgi:hypothetical protein